MPSKKIGRPRIKIDQDQFEKLCAIWATLNDIAGFMECSPDTIERWCKATYGETFAAVYKNKSGKGAVSLRRKQFEMAMQGNTALLIWLGKVNLGQTEQVRQFIDQTSVNANVNTEVESSQAKELLADLKTLIDTKVNERKG